MKLLRYIILVFVLLSLSSFFRKMIGVGVGSLGSYFLFGLMLLYYFLVNKSRPLYPFLLLGVLYFLIAGLGDVPDFNDYFNKFIKYVILIVAGAEVIRNSTKKEIYILLIIGALSVLINAVVFPNLYGRYSGFYLNPNAASLLCLMGYCISFTMPKKLKYIGVIIFTLAGLITLSRFFILMWVILSIVAVFIERKNSIIFFVGIGALLLVVTGSLFFQLNASRFSVLEGMLDNNIDQGISFFQKNSRMSTWSKYYDKIYDKPILGNGYLSLSGSHDLTKTGVHNTYLLILGESGIITFIVFLVLYFRLAIQSVKLKSVFPYLGLLAFTLMAFFLVSHNYFDNYLLLFISMWIYISVENYYNDIESES